MLELANCDEPVESRYAATAWFPIDVLAGGAAAKAVDAPNRAPIVAARGPAHVAAEREAPRRLGLFVFN